MFGKSKTSPPADIRARRALLWMHPEAVVRFMTANRWVINKGHLPDDAQFDNVFWDPMRNVWGLVVLSKDYKPLKVGEPLPELPPVEFRWHNPVKDGLPVNET